MKDRGKRLKRLRIERNLSTQDLSRYLEISPEDVENLENNTAKFTLTILNKLSDLYCCSEKYLLGLSDEFMDFSFRNDDYSPADLKAIAKINQIYKNTDFLLKKERQLNKFKNKLNEDAI